MRPCGASSFLRPLTTGAGVEATWSHLFTPLHGLGCWSLHCCGRFRGLREIDCCTTLLLIFCLILGTSWTCWNVKLLAMRYVFRNPSSPKSSLSFISFDSILQFFSVNIALTSPTISFLSVVYCTKNRYHTNFFAWEDGTPSSYSCCASSQSSLCRCILGERSSLVLEYMYYVPRPRNCCGSENLNEKKNPCPYNLCIHDYVKNQGRNI